MKTHSRQPTETNKGHDMMDKSPETYGLGTYAWVIGLSALGGAVAFYRKYKAGHARAFNVAELIGECVTSAFAGIITFYICEWSHISPLASAAMVGISGHMGSRAINNLEGFFEARFPKQTPPAAPLIMSIQEDNNERNDNLPHN